MLFHSYYRKGSIIIYRRDRDHAWLRPYDGFYAGTYPFFINRVNRRMRKIRA